MEGEQKPFMVKQTITYSDGTETVVNYRESQDVEPGVSVAEEVEKIVASEEVSEEAVTVEEAVEVPEVTEEVVVESVEESAE